MLNVECDFLADSFGQSSSILVSIPVQGLIRAQRGKFGARSAPIFFAFFKGWEGEKGVFLGPKAKLISARSADFFLDF